MQKQPRIWGKSGGVTLERHLRDILQSFEALKHRIQDESVKKCVELAIKLHDLGKVLPYFQIKVLGNTEYEPYSLDKNAYIYHSIASLLFIDKEKLRELLGGDKNLLSFVLSAVAFHHWKPSLERDMRAEDKYQALLETSGLLEKLLENLRKELGSFLSNKEKSLLAVDSRMLEGLAGGVDLSDYNVIPPYRLEWFPLRAGIRDEDAKKWILISGFLIRCDHYASYCEMAEDWNSRNEQERQSILKKVEIENITHSDILDKIKDQIAKKTNKEKEEIKLWQEEELKDEAIRKKNLILVAPTGSGKTEFAFLWSEGEKLIYTLPMRAIVEQTYDRARYIFGEDRVGLLHGDADIYLLGDDESQEKLKVYELSKELCFPVIVSTGDQFFPYALRPPLFERIYATLSYSRLVIDEVQAYDPIACAIVVKFMEDVFRLGGKFLLITATLPKFIRDEIEQRLPKEVIRDIEINLYTKNINKYKETKKHILKTDKRRWEEITKDILRDAREKGKKVLVILNTINKAQEIFNSVKAQGFPQERMALLHSEMTLVEKQKRKNRIVEMLREDGGCIVVSTQVIEAGMDIDADILYTELCPMDVLVQRMGRVLRRYKENYDIEKDEDALRPNVIVVLSDKKSTADSDNKKKDKKKVYESGKGSIYNNELLEKTLILIHEKEGFVTEDAKSDYESIWQKYYDNFKEDGEKLKKGKEKEIIKDKQITLSEYEKYQLVERLYEALNPMGKYLKQFYDTLDVLDAGYMSEKQEEAQKIFRRINNISTIHVSSLEALKQEIMRLLQDKESLTYLKFKKNIIAKFVIQQQFYKVPKERRKSLSECLKVILSREYGEKYEKIVEWSKDIFIVWDENEEDKIKKHPCFRGNII